MAFQNKIFPLRQSLSQRTLPVNCSGNYDVDLIDF